MRAAFTLLEMLVSVAVMIIIAAGALLLTRASLAMGSHLESAGRETRQEQAVLRVLREQFANLPAGTTIELVPGPEGPELLLRHAGALAAGHGLGLAPVGAVSFGGPEGPRDALTIRWHEPTDTPPALDADGNGNPIEGAAPLDSKEFGAVQARVALFEDLEAVAWRLGVVDESMELIWQDQPLDQTTPTISIGHSTTTLTGRGQTLHCLELTWQRRGVSQPERAVFTVQLARNPTGDPDASGEPNIIRNDNVTLRGGNRANADDQNDQNRGNGGSDQGSGGGGDRTPQEPLNR